MSRTAPPECYSSTIHAVAGTSRVQITVVAIFRCDQGNALVEAVKRHFPGASATLCVRGGVDIDLVLGVESFSLDNALEVSFSDGSGQFFLLVM